MTGECFSCLLEQHGENMMKQILCNIAQFPLVGAFFFIVFSGNGDHQKSASKFNLKILCLAKLSILRQIKFKFHAFDGKKKSFVECFWGRMKGNSRIMKYSLNLSTKLEEIWLKLQKSSKKSSIKNLNPLNSNSNPKHFKIVRFWETFENWNVFFSLSLARSLEHVFFSHFLRSPRYSV